MTIRWTDQYDEQRESESPLEALDEARVFDITRTGEDAFEFLEQCDQCFGLTLNREQVLKLADEIRDLANSDYVPPPKPQRIQRVDGNVARLEWRNEVTGERGRVELPIAGAEATEDEQRELIRMANEQLAVHGATSVWLTPPQTR